MPQGKVAQAPNGGGYLLSHQVNDAFVAVNRLLKANEDVYWLKSAATANGKTYPVGTMFIPAKASTLPILQKLAADKGLTFDAVAARPAGDAMKLKPVRIGLWDQYGGSMPSGWTRWIFEQYEFPFEVVFPKTLDAGNLNAKYDVLVFVDGGIPGRARRGRRTRRRRGRRHRRHGFGRGPDPQTIPAEFRDHLGSTSVATTIPQLKKFMDDGGTILAIGSATSMGYHAGLPIKNALVERVAGFAERPLPAEKFFIPGTLLEARVDTTNPLAYGMDEKTMIFFDHSPAFRLQPEAQLKGVKAVAWIDFAQLAAQRLGVGPAVSRSGGRGHRGADRQGTPRAVRARDHVARAAARHVQVPVQRDLLRERDKRPARHRSVKTQRK